MNIQVKSFIIVVLLAVYTTIIFSQPLKHLDISIINQVALELKIEETKRNKLRPIICGVSAATITALNYYYWVLRPVTQQEQQIGEMLKWYTTKKAEEDAAKKADNQTFSYKTWAYDLVKSAVDAAPSGLFSMLVYKVIPSPYSIIDTLIPGGNLVMDYLFTHRNISWFKLNRTSYKTSGEEIQQWLKYDLFDDLDRLTIGPADQVDTYKELIAMLNIFINDVEKILGYMQYALKTIPANMIIERNRAELIPKRVETIINYLIITVEDTIVDAFKNSRSIADIRNVLKVAFNRSNLEISQQIKYFKNIEKARRLHPLDIIKD